MNAKSKPLALLLGTSLVTALAFACIGEVTQSVHFVDKGVDFGVPTDEVVVPYWGENEARSVASFRVSAVTPVTGRRYSQTYEEQAATVAASLAAASVAERATNYAEAIRVLQVAIANDAEEPEKLLARIERLRQAGELKAEIAAGKPAVTLTDYQRAIALVDGGKVPAADKILAELVAAGGAVAPFAQYERGMISYRANALGNAITRFEAAAKLGGPRRETALIMAARTGLTGDKVSPENIARALKNLDELNRDFPESRFTWNALGWRARASFLAGRRSEAVVGYLHQVMTAANLNDKINAYASIREVGAKMSTADGTALRAALLADPSLLEPYCRFRLYHSGTLWDEKDRRDVPGLAKLVRQALDANPQAKVSGDLTARLAEISLLNNVPADALRLAQLSRTPLAVYVKGSALRKLGRVPEADKALSSLIKDFPDSHLVNPARELLAICQEAQGKFADALDTYRALGFDLDIAYLVDVRMSPEQVRAYASTHPEPLWALSLGYRYLRQNRLKEAESALLSIPTAERRKLAQAGSQDYRWVTTGQKDTIPDPLVTAQALIRLTNAVDAATGEKQAAAMYALGSYPYDRRNLLEYNAALWKGSRQLLLWVNPVTTDAVGQRSITTHMLEGEDLNRARASFLNLAKTHPKSEWAAKGLYRAACATRRLASFNDWWRGQNKRDDRFEASAQLMARVYREHPKSPLARWARKYEPVFRREGKSEAMAMIFGG